MTYAIHITFELVTNQDIRNLSENAFAANKDKIYAVLVDALEDAIDAKLNPNDILSASTALHAGIAIPNTAMPEEIGDAIMEAIKEMLDE
jgi:hypothetical protein